MFSFTRYYSIIVTVVSAIIIVILLFKVRYYQNQVEEMNYRYNQLQASYFTLEQNYSELYEKYDKLLKQVQLDEKKYKKKVNELLQLANKPPVRIEVPVIVEKEVQVTEEDCKKVAIMIDTAVKELQQSEVSDNESK